MSGLEVNDWSGCDVGGWADRLRVWKCRLPISYSEVPPSGQVDASCLLPSQQAHQAFSESPARPGYGSTRMLFYEFPMGVDRGLPEVLISQEQNISRVSCKVFAYKPERLSIFNNLHMAIKKCQDLSKPRVRGTIWCDFSLLGGDKWLYCWRRLLGLLVMTRVVRRPNLGLASWITAWGQLWVPPNAGKWECWKMFF